MENNISTNTDEVLYFELINKKIQKYISKGQRDKIFNYLKSSLDNARLTFASNSEILFSITDKLIFFYKNKAEELLDQQEYSQCLEVLLTCYKLSEPLPGSNWTKYELWYKLRIDIMKNIANSYQKLDKIDKSIEFLRLAINLEDSKNIVDTDQYKYDELYYLIGNHLFIVEKFNEAIKYLCKLELLYCKKYSINDVLKTKKINKDFLKGEICERYLSLLNIIASSFTKLGRYDESEKFYEKRINLINILQSFKFKSNYLQSGTSLDINSYQKKEQEEQEEIKYDRAEAYVDQSSEEKVGKIKMVKIQQFKNNNNSNNTNSNNSTRKEQGKSKEVLKTKFNSENKNSSNSRNNSSKNIYNLKNKSFNFNSNNNNNDNHNNNDNKSNNNISSRSIRNNSMIKITVDDREHKKNQSQLDKSWMEIKQSSTKRIRSQDPYYYRDHNTNKNNMSMDVKTEKEGGRGEEEEEARNNTVAFNANSKLRRKDESIKNMIEIEKKNISKYKKEKKQAENEKTNSNTTTTTNNNNNNKVRSTRSTSNKKISNIISSSNVDNKNKKDLILKMIDGILKDNRKAKKLNGKLDDVSENHNENETSKNNLPEIKTTIMNRASPNISNISIREDSTLR